MTLLQDDSFYWPWPILEGIPINEQWFRIRNDTELLNPIVQSTYYENTDGIRGHAALAGYEFGSQSFPNQYRFIYQDSGNELHFQCNRGTTTVPDWQTLFYLDCDGDIPIQFSEAARFSAGFYPQLQITVKDGTRTMRDDTISFNDRHFYLSRDSQGHPEINSKLDGTIFKDGVHTLRDDTLNFNKDHFYLSQDSAGNPSVNLSRDVFAWDLNGFIDDIPEDQKITVKEFERINSNITSIIGRTQSGSVGVILKNDNTKIDWAGDGAFNEIYFYPVQRTYIPTGNSLVNRGSRVQMDFFYLFQGSGFSWTILGNETV